MSYKRQFVSLSESVAPFFVGVDLGATNIKVGVVDDLGRPMSWLVTPTEGQRGPEDAAKRIGEAAIESIQQAGLDRKDIKCVGLGSPGTMDIPNGMLIDPVNLKNWNNFPIRDKLSEYCGLPVAFSNDAAAAAYGEFWVGAGRNHRSTVLLTLGTGIGCGIIFDGKSIVGEHSHGAECGHIILDMAEDARLCGCGQRGHLEAYASATAVVKRTQESLDSGVKTSIVARIANGAQLSPKLVSEEASAGDKFALEVVDQTARYLGIGIVTLIHTIDPDGVLLGGAMTFGGCSTALGRRFLDLITQEVKRRAFPIPAARISIDFASLGVDAGFIGAAGMAREEFKRKN